MMFLLCRSQDKGFHVEKALLHVFTRSLPYTPVQMVQVEEVVEGDRVHYNVPAELSDYVFRCNNTHTLMLFCLKKTKTPTCAISSLIRKFLSSDSFHPIKLVQDYLLEGLAEKWSISMTTEPVPFLVTAKQLHMWDSVIDSSQCYWIHLLQKGLAIDTEEVGGGTVASTSASSDKGDRVKGKGPESSRSACSLDVDPEVESGHYILRPSLLSYMEELIAEKEERINNTGLQEESGRSDKGHEVEGNEKDEACESNGVPCLFGISGVVFRNVPVSLWAQPAFHELLIRGVFPSDSEPIKLLGKKLKKLLTPYGVSVVTEDGGLHLTAQLMGVVGKVLPTNTKDNNGHISVSLSVNLDLLAVLLFSLPDWRLLWSHDPQFLKQFSQRPPPGTAFDPFSLFPKPISFDISFWTGPTWEEKKFLATVREASHGTVEHVKLMDTFSHPDLSQTSYCYRLIYHSHTHALSHTQALQFHKRLESLLSSRLQLTIR